MQRSFVERLLIAAATVSGAIVCVWLTNSVLVVIAIAVVVHLANMARRTDQGAALEKVMPDRRTRRRDDM